MCACVCVCVCAHMHAYTCVQVFVCVCLCEFERVHIIKSYAFDCKVKDKCIMCVADVSEEQYVKMLEEEEMR